MYIIQTNLWERNIDFTVGWGALVSGLLYRPSRSAACTIRRPVYSATEISLTPLLFSPRSARCRRAIATAGDAAPTKLRDPHALDQPAKH
jgi:hypothetical protein